MAVRVSALRAGRALYPLRKIPGTHFSYRLSKFQGHSAAGRIKLTRNNSITSSELEHVAFQLVAERLNQLRYRIYITYEVIVVTQLME
jgi:hypothetical protein